MSNSIAPGSSADVNVKVTALTTNPNVPVTYKTIILKKNLVNGVNTLTQEMMSAANIKYVIKYDYVLGEDITVPASCLLAFDGGSIAASGNNDTITGQNTAIQAGLVKIFNTNITLAGTWNVAEAYPEWFGAKGDGITDDRLSIQKTLNSFRKVILLDKCYLLNSVDSDNYCLNLPNNHILKGSQNDFTMYGTDEGIHNLKCGGDINPSVVLYVGGNCQVSNFSICGTLYTVEESYNTTTINDRCGIRSIHTMSLTINSVKITNVDIAYDLESSLSAIANCYAYNTKIGFFVHGGISGDRIENRYTLQANTYKNTSINMYNCYCIRARTNAYLLYGLIYSNFESLASDSCGTTYYTSIGNLTPLYHAYYLVGDYSCNMASLGAEACMKMIAVASCHSCTLSNLFMYFRSTSSIYDNDYVAPNDIVDFIYSTNIVLESSHIEDATGRDFLSGHTYYRMNNSDNSSVLLICNQGGLKPLFSYINGCSEKTIAFRESKFIPTLSQEVGNNLGVHKYKANITPDSPLNIPYGYGLLLVTSEEPGRATLFLIDSYQVISLGDSGTHPWSVAKNGEYAIQISTTSNVSVSVTFIAHP